MDKDLQKLINEMLTKFFNEHTFDDFINENQLTTCPHCKKRMNENDEFTDDGGKTWKHTVCQGLLNQNDLPVGGEEKYLKQPKGGEMSTSNVSTATWR